MAVQFSTQEQVAARLRECIQGKSHYALCQPVDAAEAVAIATQMAGIAESEEDLGGWEFFLIHDIPERGRLLAVSVFPKNLYSARVMAQAGVANGAFGDDVDRIEETLAKQDIVIFAEPRLGLRLFQGLKQFIGVNDPK